MTETSSISQNVRPEALRVDRKPRGRIMVVDDDPRNLLSIKEILSEIGEVVCLESGEEALRYLLRNDAAIILLDVLMPGIDGYETAKLIRSRERSRRTPIIFLSAVNVEQAHLLRGYDAGAVDYVFKPVDPAILRSKIAVFMELHEKTLEIQEKAAVERQLIEASLRADREKCEAQQELQRAEERQKAILAAVPIIFYSRSAAPPFRVSFVGGNVARLTGFQYETLCQQPAWFSDRIHPEDYPLMQSAQITAATSGSYSCEYRWRGADGVWKVFLDQGIQSLDPETGEDVAFGTLLDITERRRLEEELAQVRKLETLGQLTGGVAHDFNNLLASIISGVAIVQRSTALPPKESEVLNMMRHAAQQGAELINRMLTFSRRQQLRPSVIVISKFMENFERLIAPILGGLIKLQWKLDPSAGPAFADANQLELALMNLVINARDAMPTGGTISVCVENRTAESLVVGLQERDYVVFTVEDTGVGIPPENIKKVFEPFFTTKNSGKGTGLGLSTVFGFAQQSGGALEVSSEVGRGTSIMLWIPVASGQLPESCDQTAKEKEPRRLSPERRKETELLLVDDNALLSELTAKMLEENGYIVCIAGGGAEALSLIEKEPDRFELIVSDLAMPIVSGPDLIRFARSIRSNLPFIVITGYVDATALTEHLKDVPLLRKPVNDETLLNTISEVLEHVTRV